MTDAQEKIEDAELVVEDAQEEIYAVTPSFVRDLIRALERKQAERVRELVLPLHEADMADVLELLRTRERRLLIEFLGDDLPSEVLSELDEGVRDSVIDILGPKAVAKAVQELDADDAVYLLEDLDDHEAKVILDQLPQEDRQELEEGLQFEEETAGRLMQRAYVALGPGWTVGHTIDFLRDSDDVPDEFYEIFVVDGEDHPLGTVPLNKIMRTKRPVPLSDIMEEEQTTIPVGMDQEEVAYLFEQYNLVSAAVIDDNGRQVGVITVDDVVDVIKDEAEEDILSLAGVRDAEVSDSIMETTRGRFPWLLINLGTAILASAVIALFEGTIQQAVSLAILMPIVASMGGNAGTQTLTVSVRALATRDLTATNALRIIWREVVVGGLNGIAFAILMGGCAGLWFEDWVLGGVLAMAMIINMIVAGLSGILVPLGLEKANVDPALASSVFVTTVTDVVGFFAFLGLAAMLLL